MKIVVTGAAGRLGSVTCPALAQCGHDVRGVDRLHRADLPVPLSVVDLLDAQSCLRILHDADAVVHLANHSGRLRRSDQETFIENVSMNMNVFEAARQLGIQKIVFASSVQVISGDRRFGQTNNPSALPYLPLDGQTLPNPGNAYALSKLAGEIMLGYFVKTAGLSCVAIRFPALYAYDRLEQLTNEPLTSPRPGHRLDEAFTYLSMDDAAQLIGCTLAAELPGFRIYFPAAPEPTLDWPIDEIVATYFPDVPLRKPAEALSSLVDISRIVEETGWRPTPLTRRIRSWDSR